MYNQTRLQQTLGDRHKMSVITVVCYNRENFPHILTFGTKNSYRREFDITVIVITEFDCISRFLQYYITFIEKKIFKMFQF